MVYFSKVVAKEDAKDDLAFSNMYTSPPLCSMERKSFYYINANIDLLSSDPKILIQIDAAWDSQTGRSAVAWVVFDDLQIKKGCFVKKIV